ncbi:MAG: response regulator transcription factor [Eubacteriales bacterium]|nr:response regulator transcription factor [Eubacteriales bacterium]
MDGKDILVVDDEKEIAELIEIHLLSHDFRVFKAEDGFKALTIIKEKQIDLVLLDVMMPKMGGIETCKKIREISNIPIIMVTAKVSEQDKITGLSIGADDYVTKPINPLELIARVKAQLRRFNELNPLKGESAPKETRIEMRNFVIDKSSHKFVIDGIDIKLTPIEFNIIYLLASNAGKVFSTDEIFENVWTEKAYDATNTVMVHIRRLRNKLREEGNFDQIITTVWGVGYKIEK